MAITLCDLTDEQKVRFLKDRIKRDVILCKLFTKKINALKDVEKLAIHNTEICNTDPEPNLEEYID